jgi:cyclophilin family peptidyl-prolyl cis-trans isomerase
MRRLLLFATGCAILAILGSASGCKNKSETSKETPKTENSTAEVAPVIEEPAKPEQPMSENISNIPGTKVRVKTTFGDMIVLLYDETPGHKANFLKLVNEKYYDGLLFHRCIKGFMIQGGDPDSKGAPAEKQLGMGGPGYTVPAEFNPKLIHKKGALAAARQGGPVNPTKASSGSQFYIVQGTTMNDMQISQTQQYVQRAAPGFVYTDAQKEIYRTIGGTAQLDMDYTVFGEVIDGLNVIDIIASQPTKPGDRPVSDVVMSMEVIK